MDKITQETSKLNLKSFNLEAAEFVPSWLSPAAPADPAPAAQPSVPPTTDAKPAASSDSLKDSPKPLKTTAKAESLKGLSKSDSKDLYDPSQDTSKEHLNIIFMGHVDAGKSTMGGHILLLTGMVDKRTMEKYEKEAKELGRESWYLSWALDLNSEERAKVFLKSIMIYF
jgi:peptide chain release factor subunit 3